MIEAAFERSVDAGAASPLLPSRLHDFGFRGCCTVEQSVIGGAAHLLSFEGTDTLSAAYYVQVTVFPLLVCSQRSMCNNNTEYMQLIAKTGMSLVRF